MQPRRTLLCLAVGSLALLGFLGWPEFRFRRASKRYVPGATAESIESRYGVHLELQTLGNVLPWEDTEESKRHHALYEAYVPRAFMHLIFNDYRQIIGVSSTTPLHRLRSRIQ
jgi:hypothetical protein